jgi:4-amino-4-deoxy-L-arabinose transferase-like glycosyltransferase
MKKIYYILILTILLRLYHVSFPLIGWHSWRQADTASIAKNFFENGYNILYPQVLWAGNTAGYVESEFPVYPFIISLLYKIFGVNDSFGRLLSIIFSALTVYGLYLLVKALIDEKTALWSAFIYTVLPLNIYFGRAFMPEQMMLMCLVFGVYFFYKWIALAKYNYYLYSLIFITLAVLIKIPCLYIGLPLFYLAYTKYKWKALINQNLLLYTFVVLFCTFAWYWHAHNLYKISGLTFNIWGFGSDKWGNFDLILSVDYYYSIFIKSIAERNLTYIGLLIFIFGVFMPKKYRVDPFFHYWLGSILVYFLIAAKGNMYHDYYQLPITLPASVYIGNLFSKFLTKPYTNISAFKIILTASLVLILAFSAVKAVNLFLKEDASSTIFTFTNALKNHTGKDDLIVNFSEGTPVYLYLSDRKGWIIFPEKIADSMCINDLKSKGAKYLTGEKRYYHSPELTRELKEACSKHRVVADENEYFIFKLKE